MNYNYYFETDNNEPDKGKMTVQNLVQLDSAIEKILSKPNAARLIVMFIKLLAALMPLTWYIHKQYLNQVQAARDAGVRTAITQVRIAKQNYNAAIGPINNISGSLSPEYATNIKKSAEEVFNKQMADCILKGGSISAELKTQIENNKDDDLRKILHLYMTKLDSNDREVIRNCRRELFSKMMEKHRSRFQGRFNHAFPSRHKRENP